VALLNKTVTRYDAFAAELDALAATLPLEEQQVVLDAAVALRQLASDTRDLAAQASTATTKAQVLQYRKDRVAIVKAAGPIIALLEDLRTA
jgi:hypothetical protein